MRTHSVTDSHSGSIASAAVECAAVTERVAPKVAREGRISVPGESLGGVRYFRGGERTVVVSIGPRVVRFMDTIHALPGARSRAAGLPALTDSQRNHTEDLLRIVNRRGGVQT